LTLSELTNAIVVPSQAVQTGQNNQFIYVVKADPTNATTQVVEMRPVKPASISAANGYWKKV
jgi:hypothetical protein